MIRLVVFIVVAVVSLVGVFISRIQHGNRPAGTTTASPAAAESSVAKDSFPSDAAPVPVDFTSHPEASQWRTLLTEGAALGPNFAGHLTVIELPCGPECQRIAVVDARNGRVWISPWVAALGTEHRLGSRLLVVNPRMRAQEAVRNGGAPGRYVTRRYAWAHGGLELIDSTMLAPPDARMEPDSRAPR